LNFGLFASWPQSRFGYHTRQMAYGYQLTRYSRVKAKYLLKGLSKQDRLLMAIAQNKYKEI
jgi:hypothetical protein